MVVLFEVRFDSTHSFRDGFLDCCFDIHFDVCSESSILDCTRFFELILSHLCARLDALICICILSGSLDLRLMSCELMKECISHLTSQLLEFLQQLLFLISKPGHFIANSVTFQVRLLIYFCMLNGPRDMPFQETDMFGNLSCTILGDLNLSEDSVPYTH